MSDDAYERGMRIRREVLGDEHVDRAIESTTEHTAAFQELITRYAWGEIWARPGLDRKMRSAVTLTALVALGASLDDTDNRGRTALMIAAGLGDAAVVDLLLQRGADRALQDKQGKTALDLAANPDVRARLGR